MTYKPRSVDEIYQSVEEKLKGRISKLTNFTRRSFNYVWTRAFANEFRDLEVRVLAAELSAFIEYTGGPVDEDDLRELGITDVDPEEVNQYLSDDFLDEYVKLVGIRRFEGARATGTVEIERASGTTNVPAGTIVTTTLDSTDEVVRFETTEDLPTGTNESTVVQGVGIQALEPGEQGNVPAGAIVRFEDPPVGVKRVINNADTSGGEDRESNEELRARAKDAIEGSSNGGTTAGIKGYIRENVEGVGQGDVVIDELFDRVPPTVDVVVEGGTEQEIVDAIEFSRPTGVKHEFFRPEEIAVGYDSFVRGSSVRTSDVESVIEDFLLELGISENLYEDAIVQEVMNSDDSILNIDTLGGFIERVNNEQFIYDTNQSEYTLSYTYEDSNGSITVTDSDGVEYAQGTDYEVNNYSNQPFSETLVWLSGQDPNDGQRFSVDYDVTVPGLTTKTDYYSTNEIRAEQFTWNDSYQDVEDYEITQDVYKLDYVPFPGTLSITDESGDTYTEGTDFDLIENGTSFKQFIDWSIGGSTPDDNERYTATYDQKVYVTENQIVDSSTDQISDRSGNTYDEGSEYELVSYEITSGENNAIEWTNNPSTFADGEKFYFSYITQGDIETDKREKISAGSSIDVTEV